MPALSFLYSDYKFSKYKNKMEHYYYEQQKFIDRDCQGDKRTIQTGLHVTKQVCISDCEFKGGGVWVNVDSLISNNKTSICEIVPTQLAFTCQICGESQSFYGNERIIFPICNNCKSDLKEYVLSVRKK